jgi:hypothetical protein
MVALYLVKWLDTIDMERESGLLDVEELEILARLQELLSQTDLNVKDDRLSAVVLELGAGLLSEACVYGCSSLTRIMTNSNGSSPLCRSCISSTCKTIQETHFIVIHLIKVSISCSLLV